MNVELKAKWVEALRSGKFKQTTGTFRDEDNHYCCLGVLCVVMGEEPIGIAGTSRWSVVHPVFTDGVTTSHKLADMNDGAFGRSPSTFAEIADHIEANL